MIDAIKQKLKPVQNLIENILKFGAIKNHKTADGDLQVLQIKTLRGIENALKIGQFGFNSKAPLNSRVVVANIGNTGVVIANESIAHILDVETGEAILYNKNGDYVKIGLDKTELNADMVEMSKNCKILGSLEVGEDILAGGNITATLDVNATNVFATAMVGAAGFTGPAGVGAVVSTEDIVSNSISLQNHTHSYTWTDPAGGGNTGTPN